MRVTILVFLAASAALGFGQDAGHSPQLLLTPQRLKRLQRDLERQTARWINFENRVQSVPDSAERGFELALYYAITHDERRGREAVEWALAHKCAERQVALVLDWCANLISAEERQTLGPDCPFIGTGSPPLMSEVLRDHLFKLVALGENPGPAEMERWKAVMGDMKQRQFMDSRALYAAIELIDAARTTQHIDLREDDRQFFSILPTELLLSLKPSAVEHPDWMTHIAALALVSLDPNLEGSQYLQGWAIEDRQMLREGQGVAYELLWGDPYLPGVGYQNLDPWVYDETGRLFARSDWSPGACWVDISKDGVQDENCPGEWRREPVKFGRMTLIPMTQSCAMAPDRMNNEVAILWKLRPHQALSYVEKKMKESAEADAAGMWRLPGNVEGKVCVVR
ncbi:MAG: hypothetical protein WB992_02415 [Bryobacteraceae bacterium]